MSRHSRLFLTLYHHLLNSPTHTRTFRISATIFSLQYANEHNTTNVECLNEAYICRCVFNKNDRYSYYIFVIETEGIYTVRALISYNYIWHLYNVMFTCRLRFNIQKENICSQVTLCAHQKMLYRPVCEMSIKTGFTVYRLLPLVLKMMFSYLFSGIATKWVNLSFTKIDEKEWDLVSWQFS